MSYMVIITDGGTEPRYRRFEDLGEAAAYVEMLRNEHDVADAELFRLDRLHYEVKPYYRVLVEEPAPLALQAASTPDDRPQAPQTAAPRPPAEGPAEVRTAHPEPAVETNAGAQRPSTSWEEPAAPAPRYDAPSAPPAGATESSAHADDAYGDPPSGSVWESPTAPSGSSFAMGPAEDEPVLHEPISAAFPETPTDAEVSDAIGDEDASFYGQRESSDPEATSYETPRHEPSGNAPGAWGEDQAGTQSSGRRGLFGR